MAFNPLATWFFYYVNGTVGYGFRSFDRRYSHTKIWQEKSAHHDRDFIHYIIYRFGIGAGPLYIFFLQVYRRCWRCMLLSIVTIRKRFYSCNGWCIHSCRRIKAGERRFSTHLQDSQRIAGNHELGSNWDLPGTRFGGNGPNLRVANAVVESRAIPCATPELITSRWHGYRGSRTRTEVSKRRKFE